MGSLYRLLDLETGEVRRWTDVMGGNFTPMELERLDDARTLAVTTYVRGRYRLFRMNLEDPVEVIRPEDEAYEPVEVVKQRREGQPGEAAAQGHPVVIASPRGGSAVSSVGRSS